VGWTSVLLVGLVLLAIAGDGDPVEGVTSILNTIERGRRLTHASYGPDGVVRVKPQQLADEAGTDLDTYALARMISSEHGRDDNVTKAAIAHVALNYAARVGRSISGLLLRANNAQHSGFFGTQRDIDEESTRYNESDRYASTALDPYEGELQIATAVLSGEVPDPTGGAIQFDAPPAFKSPEAAARTAANRLAEGRVQVFPDGIDPDKLRFWA
jgi:hypothetical protein